MTDDQTAAAPEGAADPAVPNVFQALTRVMGDIAPVGKDQRNEAQKYRFRGIDDLMSAVAGPMRRHGMFLLPTVIDSRAERRGEKMTAVYLTMRYRLYGPNGDYVEATVPGEASDFADKATNKAMSAALKYFLLQVFMIPVDAKSIDDGDRHHPENPPAAQGHARKGRPAEQEPEWESSRPAAATPRRAPRVVASQDDPVMHAAAMARMKERAEQIGFAAGLPAQFAESFNHPIEQGTIAEFKQAYLMMTPDGAE